MFIGHYGIGLAAKKYSSNDELKKPSLGTLFLAAQFLDLLWPIFILSGIEFISINPQAKPFQTLNFLYYPFSHSLLSALIWACLFGLTYYLLRKNIKYSVMLSMVVLSHWILDLISHMPDLQFIPGINLRAGFSLWSSVALTVIIESFIFITGAFLYVSATKAKNKKGIITFCALLIFLYITYILSIIGPPPASVNAVAISGFSQLIIIAWGYWIDRNREPLK